jgi:hypothetical protein
MAKPQLKLRYRFMFFILTCLAILVADMTIALINKYILSYKGTVGKHYITLIGMAAVLVIFYIFVKNINRISEIFVNKFVQLTRVFLGREIGLYISAVAIFLIIFAGYYWIWFDRNLINEITAYYHSLKAGIISLIKNSI